MADPGHQPFIEVQSVLDALDDAVLLLNAEGNVVAFNTRFLACWRMQADELCRCTRQDIASHIALQIEQPETVLEARGDEMPQTLRLKSGQVLECAAREMQIGETTSGCLWLFRDITEHVHLQDTLQSQLRALRVRNVELQRRVAESTQALDQSEQHFKQLVAGIRDCAIYMLDAAGHVISWNPGAERIKGFRKEDIIGAHFSSFYTEEDRLAGIPHNALRIAAAEGKYEAEGWRVRKDGTRFWASVLIDAIRDSQGTLLGFAKITRDMTEKRAIQEQLHQSQKMEAIGQLTGGVAHDFNNLLTVILGNLDTIKRHMPAEEGKLRRAVEHALSGARRAAMLTQQLLAFARRQPLNPKPTDVNRLVTDVSGLVRRTLPENIAVEAVLAAGLWRVEVDPHQLESALLNLVVNSRDAMPDGGKLTIETANTHIDEYYASRHTEIKPGQYVLICVSDTGTGMTNEVLTHAFDPFYTTKPIGQGTGLGLSQVFGFVKQSGGHVKLYSEPDEGTTVKIYLPRLLVEMHHEDMEPGVAEPSGLNETILLVEDDEHVRVFSTEALRELGYRVIEAQDGARALRLLQSHPEINLMFTDVGLPGLNGRELVEAARRHRQDLKVLYTSGYPRNAIVHQGRLDAGVALLTKPFTQSQLAAKVREVLDTRTGPLPRRSAIVIDDEPLVCSFLTEALQELGYSVAQASDAAQGLALAERETEAVLAFVDLGLPDRHGADLAQELRTRWQRLNIVMVSGYGEPPVAALNDDPAVAFLQKPFDICALQQVLERFA